MRNDKFGAVIVLLAIFLLGIFAATNANAVDVYWANPINSNYTWLGGPWEDVGHAPALPPVDGDRIMLNTGYSLAHCSIDVAGATLNLPNSSMGFGYGGRNWSFYDSATLTPNADPMADPTDFNLGPYPSLEAAAAASTQKLTLAGMDWSKSGNPYFFIPVEVTGVMKNPENGPLHFYGPATIGTDDVPRNTGWTSELYYHGDATIGTKNVAYRSDGNDEQTWFYGVTSIGTLNQDGGKVYLEPTSSVTIDTLNLSRGIFNTKVAPTINNVNWTGGVWIAGADGALPSPAPFTLSEGQTLRFDAVQTSLPVITVGAGGALAGNMTNVVYTPGPGQNVVFQNDGIHAPDPEASTPLQKSDLGAGVGVWLGVTSRGAADVWEAGDDGTNPYKGLAFDTNSFTPGGETRSTFRALPGSGDLLLRVSSLLDLEYRGPYWIGDGTSTTANFTMVGETSRIDLRRRFNEGSTDADRILTFNLTRAPGNERADILTTNQQTGVYADQTINVTGGNIGSLDAMKSRFEGSLTLTDGTWAMGGTDFTGTDTGTLTLAGRTVMELPTADNVNNDFLEALGSRFTYSGLPMVTFSDKNGGPFIYEFDLDQTASGSTPVLAQFLANVDYGSNHYHPVDIGGDGLLIGDGRFLTDAGTTNATSSYVAHNTTGTMPTIMPGQPGDITMGFAAVAKNLAIGLEVVAPDATVQIGTTDPNRLLTSGGNGFVSAGIPTMRVTFQEDVTAAGVRVESGTAQFDQDLATGTVNILDGATLTMAGGRTATASEMLTGGGTFTGGNGIILAGGGTLAPGDGIGTLTGDANLALGDGTSYQWEIADPDGGIGTGWDMFQSDSLVDLSGANSLTFNIVDAGITREITTDEQFVVASAANFNIPGSLALNFSVVPDVATWNISGAQLVPDVRDIGNGPEPVLYLTGVSATFGAAEVVPEPSTLVLAALGLLGLGIVGWRRRRTG